MSTDLNQSEPPLEVDARTVKSLLDEGADLLLIDCREPAERAICSIEPSLFLPMREIPERLSELEPHRNRHIVVHCHGGIRSLQVTQWLRRQGFNNVQNLSGGIDAWSLQIDNSVPRY